MQKFKHLWAVSLMFLASGAAAYDLQDMTYEAEDFRVGSCTFNANARYNYYDSEDYSYASGQIELQSNLPGIRYRYVGPKFVADMNYDREICTRHG